nr:RecName: Full=Unknown protein from spot 406 of 2D-PAGE of etiolated coleoptile [Zea mays]
NGRRYTTYGCSPPVT